MLKRLINRDYEFGIDFIVISLFQKYISRLTMLEIFLSFIRAFIKNVLSDKISYSHTISVRWKLVYKYIVWFQLVHAAKVHVILCEHYTNFYVMMLDLMDTRLGWSLCISLKRYSTSFFFCLPSCSRYFQGIFIKLHHLRCYTLYRSLFFSSSLKIITFLKLFVLTKN